MTPSGRDHPNSYITREECLEYSCTTNNGVLRRPVQKNIETLETGSGDTHLRIPFRMQPPAPKVRDTMWRWAPSTGSVRTTETLQSHPPVEIISRQTAPWIALQAFRKIYLCDRHRTSRYKVQDKVWMPFEQVKMNHTLRSSYAYKGYTRQRYDQKVNASGRVSVQTLGTQ